MTNWVKGQDDKTTLDNIEKSWPAADARDSSMTEGWSPHTGARPPFLGSSCSTPDSPGGDMHAAHLCPSRRRAVATPARSASSSSASPSLRRRLHRHPSPRVPVQGPPRRRSRPRPSSSDGRPISVGLIYPAILTIRRAFYSGKFFDLNFGTPNPREIRRLRQLPGLVDHRAGGLPQHPLLGDPSALFATGLRLLYAILIDWAKGECSRRRHLPPDGHPMVGATPDLEVRLLLCRDLTADPGRPDQLCSPRSGWTHRLPRQCPGNTFGMTSS